MTLDDFRKLKTGDKVVVYNKIYVVSVGFNIYSVPFIEFLMNDRSVYRIYNKECSGIFSVYENNNNFVEQIPHGKFKFVNDMEIYDEKKYLETQLKEEQNILNEVTDKIISIKTKLEELSKPKLKIGGLYKFKFNGNPRSTLGVLYWCGDGYCSGVYKFITPGLNCLTVDFNTTNGIDYNTIKNMDFKEITNPKYSHIGKTILDFIKLNPESFQ